MNSNKFFPIFGLLLLLILAIGSGSASEIDSCHIGDSSADIDLAVTEQPDIDEVDDSNIVKEENFGNDFTSLDDTKSINDEIGSIEGIEIGADIKDNLGANNLTSTVKFKESDYSNYFNSKGSIISGKLKPGDTLDFSGIFKNKSFNINIPLIITSTENDANLVDCNFNIINGAQGIIISNLKANMSLMEKPIINAYDVSRISVISNDFYSVASKSYPILFIGVNESSILNNRLQTTCNIVGWGHPSVIVLTDSHYNNISGNNVITNDSNGIYLTGYLGGGSMGSGGGSNSHNYIFNNTVHSVRGMEWAVDENGRTPMPSSFAYGIQVMGADNEIINNFVYNVYRGISATQSGNKIVGNVISNIHGTWYSGNTKEEGGDYAIYVGTDSLVKDNKIFDSIFNTSSAAAIFVGNNSQVTNNYLENIHGIGLYITGNSINFTYNSVINSSSFSVLSQGNSYDVIIANNILVSDSVAICLQKTSRVDAPHDFIIENNVIPSSNIITYEDSYSENIALSNNGDISGDYGYDAGNNVKTYYVYESNLGKFFATNGYLTNVDEGSTIIFLGELNNKGKLYISNKVNIKGFNNYAKFTDTTFIILDNDVSIEDLTILNPNKVNAERVWGIQVKEASNVTIKNCHIFTFDSYCAYAIYLLDSSDINIIDNYLETKGNYLTAAILSFNSKNVLIEGNYLKSIGTGEKYLCNNQSCLDGYLSICADGCIDGCTDGCVDGCTDGCIDGEGSPIDLDGVYPGTHIVKNIFKTYGFLMVHPTNITFTNNKVDVTSSLEPYYDLNESCNAIGGVFIQYGGFNNTISNNEIFLDSNDPIAYGIGIVGATANSSAEGSKNNTFSYNNVTIKSLYHAVGISLGNKAIESNISNNDFKIYAVQAHNILNNTGVEEDNNLLDNNNFDVTTRHNTVLIVSDVSYKFNNLNKIISITLKDKNGSSIANKKISVIVDGVSYYGTTNNNGVVTVKVSLSKVGIYSITAKFDTEDDFVASTSKGKLTLTKDSTSLTSSGKTYAVTASSKSITLTLKDGNGNVIANKKVTATVNGKTYTATTNSKGVATFKLTLKTVKTFTVSLKFAGDSYYTASSKSIKVKVTKTKTKLTVPKKTFKKAKKVKKLTATLKDQFGKVIKSKKVTFTVNGKKYTAKTNKKGVATVKVKLSKKKTYKVTVKFAGDKTYYAVKKTGKVVIK